LKNILTKPYPIIRKIIKFCWVILLCFILGVPLFIYSVSINLFGLYGGMPGFEMLENPENDLSSELFTSDGTSLGRYYRFNRSQVLFEDLSPALVNTLISSEDHRFYQHAGIDFEGLARAAYYKLTFRYAGGGSTITMQLAENLYNTMTENQGSLYSINIFKQLIIKTKEWIIAAILERNFTKEEIIAMYFNTVPFGSNAFGIKTATETFFDKQPGELNYAESAVLVAMLQANHRFNPYYNYENAISKRNQVLRKVNRHEHITKETMDSLVKMPIDLSRYKVESHNTGSAPYFRNVVRAELMNWCNENGYDLWEDGLKIYTTIDSRMQRYMEEAVKAHMPVLQDRFFELWKGRNPWRDEERQEIPDFIENRFKRTDAYKSLAKKYRKNTDSLNIVMNLPRPMRVFSWKGEIDTLLSPLDSMRYYKHFLHAGFMAIDPHLGQVRAWVGGINHQYFQYDHVKQGKRQPGSTFKTFVYGKAMSEDYSPCQKFNDTAPTFNDHGKLWRPENAAGGYGTGEQMTLRQAMARSVNSITAQVMQRVNPQNVVNFAHAVGIKSDLLPVPSLCLGTEDVSVFELIGAYSTFVNKGIHIEPYFITRIEDKNGNVVYNTIPEMNEAIDEQTAYKVLYMLRGGVEEQGGTSAGLSMAIKKDNQVGGKTGTTNNASDGWYVGVTKDLVAGGWVGGEERSIHFERWSDGQGGKTARPIWDQFMQKVYADSTLGITKGPFPAPINGIDMVLDCDMYINNENDSTEAPVEQWDPDVIQ